MPEVEGVEHRYVAVNGARLHYAGSGRGDSARAAAQLAAALVGVAGAEPGTARERYRVICPDIRGFGWSEGGSDYGLEQLAADIVGLLDAARDRAGPLRRARLGRRDRLPRVPQLARPVQPLRADRRLHALVERSRRATRLYLRSWHIYALGLLGSSATTRLGVPESALRSWRHAGQLHTRRGADLPRRRCGGRCPSTPRAAVPARAPPRAAASRSQQPSAPLQVPTLHVHGEQDPLAGGALHGPRRGAADTGSSSSRGAGTSWPRRGRGAAGAHDRVPELTMAIAAAELACLDGAVGSRGRDHDPGNRRGLSPRATARSRSCGSTTAALRARRAPGSDDRLGGRPAPRGAVPARGVRARDRSAARGPRGRELRRLPAPGADQRRTAAADHRAAAAIAGARTARLRDLHAHAGARRDQVALVRRQHALQPDRARARASTRR